MVTPTTLALSSAVPVQPGPGSSQRSGATNSALPAGLGLPAFTQGSSSDVPMRLNQVIVDLANAARFGGLGCGVAAGLAPVSDAGLALTFSAGVAVGPGGLAYLAAASPVVVSDGAASFVWLTQTGGLVATGSTAPPAGAAAYLGKVVAASGAIASIDIGGVVRIGGGMPVRTTGDRGYPVDVPSFPMLASTQAGTFLWDGSAWRAQGTPTNAETIGAMRTLAQTDAPRQVLDPGAATRKVLVPSARIPDGVLEIHHGGAGGTLQVRDASDATTLATLTSGQRCVLYPSFAPSGAAYPTATPV